MLFAPHLRFSPLAQLLKLNIYPEGGMFTPHRDTPLSERTLGSLVVTLPLRHAGGELLVNHGDEKKIFDFSAMLGLRYDQRRQTKEQFMCEKGIKIAVAYAAFFGDAVHEVKPVLAGHRLTLTYQLLRASSLPVPVPVPNASVGYIARMQHYRDMPLAQLKEECTARGLVRSGEHHDLIVRLAELPGTGTVDDVLAKKAAKVYIPPHIASSRTQNLLGPLQRALESEAFFTKRGFLGFPCFHLYESKELPNDSVLNDMVTTKSIRMKGADALLAVAAARMGLSVKVLR